MSTERQRQAGIRSLLFAPANDERKVAKLPQCGADVIVLDLEDAVANSAKAGARVAAGAALKGLSHPGRTAVRVNGSGTGMLELDLDAVVTEGLDLVVVPKVESPSEIEWIDERLAALESERGMPPGTVSIVPLIETAHGVIASVRIAAARSVRLTTLAFGSGDFVNEVGVEPGEQASELLYARSRIMLAARAAELGLPLDGPILAFRDVERLAEDSERSRRLGFGGRVVVHPSQVRTVNDVYSRRGDGARLRQIVEAFEAAERQGVAAIDVDGLFVDYPVYGQALRQLASRSDNGIEVTQ